MGGYAAASQGGGAATGDTIGYNCENINALRTVINDTAQKAGAGIVAKLEEGIVTPMSTVWYAPEAQTFFENFATAVQASGQAITEAFDIFRQNIEAAGAAWAEKTKGEAPTLAAIDTVELQLNVSSILAKNEAGSVIIKTSEAETVANGLSDVEANIKTELESLAAVLDADTAFIGGGQASAIEECFVKVSGEIYKIFQFLTTGENNIHDAIKQAAASYSEGAQTIGASFSGTGA